MIFFFFSSVIFFDGVYHLKKVSRVDAPAYNKHQTLHNLFCISDTMFGVYNGGLGGGGGELYPHRLGGGGGELHPFRNISVIVKSDNPSKSQYAASNAFSSRYSNLFIQLFYNHLHLLGPKSN